MACTVPYSPLSSAAAQPRFERCRRSCSPLSSAAAQLPFPLCRWSCSPLSPAAKPFQPRRLMVQWRPSAPGWFKLNFDGSYYYDGSGRASIGGVIRDCYGRVLVAFAERTEHSSVGIVEARALIRGLRLALDNYIGKLVVEGDDLVLVKLLRGEDTYTRIPEALQEEILMLLGRFSACEVQHIYREGNQVADTLCHEAYHTPGVWKDGLMPLAALEKVQDDALGVVHERIRNKAMV